MIRETMKAIFYTMILLCNLPASATWDFSWESAQSYIPSMPSLEFPSISVKPYLGWIFGTTCLLVSAACVALIKNNTKYEIAQAKQDAVNAFAQELYSEGFVFDRATKATSFLCTVRGITKFNMNIGKKNKEYFFLEVARKSSFTECLIDPIIFENSRCRNDYMLLVRFEHKETLYRFRDKLSMDDLMKDGTLVPVK